MAQKNTKGYVLKEFFKSLLPTLIYLLKKLLLDIMSYLKNFPRDAWYGLRTDPRERFFVGYFIFIMALIWLLRKIEFAVEMWWHNF